MTSPLSSPPEPQGGWAVGDVLMLLDPVFPGCASLQQDLADLLALLECRRFLRWRQALEHITPLNALEAAMAANNLGCRLRVDSGEVAPLDQPRTGSLLLACRSNAHLALAVVAERSGRFQALAIGRVVAAGFELHVDGRGERRSRKTNAEVAEDSEGSLR